ncbi:NAD(P)/FAD-dependent oxidoreductase [Tenacibaculum caenipelagi]|uniref:Flavin-dependent dehydrogenase n=1 Tax=Tenacibaculum caenipelagi TaxID=1325435 RepID=A0A4R6TF41_9FLAO|nr:NAD(P)/FAD-dependent oxidoreductase [Tenacibaculum caenipelagi]TDQ28847.1 flavin-dependent dehydrogenase [Tenacibaculum caenipelagi]
MNNIDVDVLIIGSGPSGCVSAAYLHKKGINVKIVEKAIFPRFVIGESLLPKCMEHFEEVGLLETLKKQNFEIKRGARFIKNNQVCNFDFSKKFTEGWNWTWQVPRADFDKTLTDELEKKGVDISFNTEVINVSFYDEHTETTLVKEGKTHTVKAKYIIDASGYGKVLPRLLKLQTPSKLSNHSAIFTHIKETNRPKGEEGTIITFDILDTKTWFWVIPFSNGVTSIGFVGTTEYINSIEGETGEEKMKNLLKTSKYYHDRFKNEQFLFPPKTINNYASSITKMYGDKFVITGNSAEFLDPVFSSGVTFATESGLLAAKLVYKELSNTTVDWDTEYVAYMKNGINVFSTYVKEWYNGNLQKLFFHEPENPEIKRQICAVLAGYVWDKENPFVKKHNRLVKNLAYLIDMENEQKKSES